MRKVVVCLCMVGAALVAPAVAQDRAGAIVGHVTGNERGGAVAGALVTIEGLSIQTSTDRQGAFRLTGVPAGSHKLIVTYIGRASEKKDVTVEPGRALEVNIELPNDIGYSETVQVTGDPIAEGQESALNQQKTAPNITNVVSADRLAASPTRMLPKPSRECRVCRSPATRVRAATSSFAAPKRG
jgi:Carboxypeptidase regulatory-like domain